MANRRSFIALGSSAVATALLHSRVSFASIPGDRRLVFVFLRGGLDGMHALVPHGDSHYKQLRPRISAALDAAGGTEDLDGYFGLHHALTDLMPWYRSKELLLIPAATTRYRDRSHFDAQNLLENGSGKPYGARSGWLNRALMSLVDGDERLGLSIGPAVPLILQGDAGVQTWSNSRLPEVDDDFLMRMTRAYESDPLFLKAMMDANDTLQPDLGMDGMNRRRGENFPLSAKAAADLLAQEHGPRVAVLELGGWDTHFDQERRLANLFNRVSAGLVALRRGLGAHWRNTAVVVVSEFGRTAAENGNRGTDHGTGGLAMLAGGAIAGGRVAGEWPGLSDTALWQGRDVRAVNSYESLFKGLLIDHLQLTHGQVEDIVFPGSRAFAPAENLLRRA